ncbi:MAG: endonuclease domain-containing protein [Ignavibacteria bacterium]|nr:endonuclease domain-containing protein [Ignavibacteria bacterium]
MKRIFNRTEEKEKRRKLRNNMTNAEKLLWERIRNRQVRKKRFLRQYSVLKYVIDFYCPEIKLAIEVDGDIHISEESIEYDKNRQTEIENYGIKFLRIKNEEVFANIHNVILKIETIIDGTPLNPPFCKGGK